MIFFVHGKIGSHLLHAMHLAHYRGPCLNQFNRFEIKLGCIGHCEIEKHTSNFILNAIQQQQIGMLYLQSEQKPLKSECYKFFFWFFVIAGIHSIP